MALPTEFFVYVGYGLFAIVACWLIMGWLLGGFLAPFMAVKRSRGRKVLVRIRNPIQDYFRAGMIEENFLIFKDREKNMRRIPLQQGVVSRGATVYWVEVDDEKNCLFLRDTGAAVATMDAVKNDSLYVRALYKPSVLGQNMIKYVIILGVITLLVVMVIAFLVYKQKASIDLILQTVRVADVTAGAGIVI